MSKQATRLFLAGLSVGLYGLLPALAWGQTAATQPSDTAAPIIGKILTAKGSVTLEHTGAVVIQASLPSGGQTKVDDPVYLGDIISTGADGAAGIGFADGTSFNISANARMELNEFVYSPKGKSNSSLFNLTKGAFTFIAGEVAHTGDMKVGTPVATMGIRGTAPYVQILEDGTVKFTTLVEENKKKAATATPGQRDAQSSPRPDASAIEKTEKDLNKSLKICRNC
jgi:hypothetical protein